MRDADNRLLEEYRLRQKRSGISNFREALTDILGFRPGTVHEGFAGAYLFDQGFVPKQNGPPLPREVHSCAIHDQKSAIKALREVLGNYRFCEGLDEDEESVIQLLATQETYIVSAIVRWLKAVFQCGYCAGETMEQESWLAKEDSKYCKEHWIEESCPRDADEEAF